jgi:hypothetical protein
LLLRLNVLAPRGFGAPAIAGDGVTGRGEAREVLDVHLQQIARAGPLEPAHLLLGWLGPARAAPTLKAT